MGIDQELEPLARSKPPGWMALTKYQLELRDQFAVAALSGLLATCPAGHKVKCDNVATLAYEMADAMMAARLQ